MNYFDTLTRLAVEHGISDDQLFSIDKYFNFSGIIEKQDQLESYVLFFVICFLVYIWVKLFAWYDKR